MGGPWLAVWVLFAAAFSQVTVFMIQNISTIMLAVC